jgi:hypothetical protein
MTGLWMCVPVNQLRIIIVMAQQIYRQAKKERWIWIAFALKTGYDLLATREETQKRLPLHERSYTYTR